MVRPFSAKGVFMEKTDQNLTEVKRLWYGIRTHEDMVTGNAMGLSFLNCF
jgi:hypothetical protein